MEVKNDRTNPNHRKLLAWKPASFMHIFLHIQMLWRSLEHAHFDKLSGQSLKVSTSRWKTPSGFSKGRKLSHIKEFEKRLSSSRLSINPLEKIFHTSLITASPHLTTPCHPPSPHPNGAPTQAQHRGLPEVPLLALPLRSPGSFHIYPSCSQKMPFHTGLQILQKQWKVLYKFKHPNVESKRWFLWYKAWPHQGRRQQASHEVSDLSVCNSLHPRPSSRPAVKLGKGVWNSWISKCSTETLFQPCKLWNAPVTTRNGGVEPNFWWPTPTAWGYQASEIQMSIHMAELKGWKRWMVRRTYGPIVSRDI